MFNLTSFFFTEFTIGVRHVQILYMWVCGAVFGAIRGSTGVVVVALTDNNRINDTYIQVNFCYL